MTATHSQNCTVPTGPLLYLALELGSKTWKLAFTTGMGFLRGHPAGAVYPERVKRQQKTGRMAGRVHG